MKTIQFAVFLFLLCVVSVAQSAENGHLILIDQDRKIQLPLDDLRQKADMELSLYDPFRGEELQIRGIMLDKLLKDYFGRLPDRLKLTAHDGYALVFDKWTRNNWVLVTHENGRPISLRQRGPLRLVELDIGEKNKKNLRDFNDWVWMLETIEAIK